MRESETGDVVELDRGLVVVVVWAVLQLGGCHNLQ
jgi:hypothetical protein